METEIDAELTEFMHRAMPFMKVIGARGLIASAEEVRTALDWDETRCTSGGAMHGGVLMALADGTGGWLAFLNLPEGASTTTLESKTNLLRAVREGSVTATSRPLHVGRTVIVVDTELRDGNDRLVARTTQTQAVLTGR